MLNLSQTVIVNAVTVFLFAPLTFAQTIQLKDRNGIPVATVSEYRMFRYYPFLRKNLADFECTVKNTSGADLESLNLRAIVHKKDGSKVELSFYVGNILKDSTKQFHENIPTEPYTPDDLDSVEFALPDLWQSPEDNRRAAEEKAREQRIAAEAQAKKDAADAARRKRLAVEQKKKDDELNARLAKQRAEEEAKTTEERRQIRAACALIYRNTADKKVVDLTVKEEQQVRTCQALNFYPPR